ncbi:MAG: hypothetical protein M1824_001468 [Vezdaea acicularis]|nr:MAG: hypothetical protein M1824_001468 [Vezdaea acicularis]
MAHVIFPSHTATGKAPFDSGSPSDEPQELSESQLQGLPLSKQLQLLVERIKTAAEKQEPLVESAIEAWDYIINHQTWRANYPTLEALKDELNRSAGLDCIIKTHESIVSRKQLEITGIEKEWKCSPDQALPSHMKPEQYSHILLRGLNQLSRVLPKEEAIRQLTIAITTRQSKIRTRKSPFLSYPDIKAVLDQIQSKKNACEVAKANDTNLGDVAGSEVVAEEDTSMTGSDLETITGASTHNEEEKGGDNEEDDDRDEENEGDNDDDDDDNVDNDKDEDMMEAGEDQEDQDMTEAGDSLISNDKGQNQNIQPCLAKLMSKRKKISCRCPKALIKEMECTRAGRLEDKPSSGIKLLKNGRKYGLGKLCHNHLRVLAGKAMMLKTSRPSTALIERLETLWQNHGQLDQQRVDNAEWFTGMPPAKMYKFIPLPAPAFDFNSAIIFDCFAGDGMWSRWIDQGTINIPKFFSYLVDSPTIFSKVEQEFDMYQHHYSAPENTRGWLRIMYYSLTQQVIRQDPAYYAVTVASRPDKNWRLISYPYYTKDTTNLGKSTEFRHFDMNVRKFLSTGKGGNIIQGCVALDDETDNDCTMLIPEFHKHIAEWWGEVTRRKQAIGEQLPNGETTNIPSEMYTPEDKKRFGAFVPCPSQRGGIRITRPDIAHGSSKKAGQRRRTIFPWFTGIRDDHQTLDNEESETWDQLAAYHRALLACYKSPSGRSADAYGRPDAPFAAGVKLFSTWAIGDALIGARRWDDPMVVRDRNRLLGPDSESRIALVQEVRQRLLDNFLEAFLILEEAEKTSFGSDSFFLKHASVVSCS